MTPGNVSACSCFLQSLPLPTELQKYLNLASQNFCCHLFIYVVNRTSFISLEDHFAMPFANRLSLTMTLLVCVTH